MRTVGKSIGGHPCNPDGDVRCKFPILLIVENVWADWILGSC